MDVRVPLKQNLRVSQNTVYSFTRVDLLDHVSHCIWTGAPPDILMVTDTNFRVSAFTLFIRVLFTVAVE